jgi:hypothetical protein
MTFDDTPNAPVDSDGGEVMHTVRATSDDPASKAPALEITGDEGNFDDPTRPEVRLLLRSTCDCCEDFAQGRFRVDELRAALDAAVVAGRPDVSRR